MRKLLSVLTMLIIALTGAAAIGEPGPNGKNNHGLC